MEVNRKEPGNKIKETRVKIKEKEIKIKPKDQENACLHDCLNT
jgi:hypothetical protein